MADRAVAVPLTPYQREVLALLAQTRTPDSYLAGGAALHIAPNSIRYSHDLEQTWLAALSATEEFARSRPAEEAGCLYYSASRKRFVLPEPDVPLADQGVAPHWGRPGGILPRAVEP